MSDKNLEIIAKPNQKEIASPPKQPKQEDKHRRYHYVQGEEPESSSVSSFARGRMGTVSE
ncbi:MAG: hypothetical protein G01um10142_538 [Parcubacteria group bacterium Gr01-1014_2]|nr:MAG: hypothetical protein G01um10142_538 [Parcubacteria group bacterium Gr01-1014_2]